MHLAIAYPVPNNLACILLVHAYPVPKIPKRRFILKNYESRKNGMLPLTYTGFRFQSKKRGHKECPQRKVKGGKRSHS